MAGLNKFFLLKKFGSVISGWMRRDANRKKTPVEKKGGISLKGKHIKKIARVWDAKGLSRDAHRKLNWMDFSIIENSINERISKDPQKNWLIWVKEKYCQGIFP